MYGIYIHDKHIINDTELYMDNLCSGIIENQSKCIAALINSSNIISDLNTLVQKMIYKFGTNTYLFYYYNNEWYIDIHHVLSLMDLSHESFVSELQKYYPECDLSMWILRGDGVCVHRKLIDLETMTKIILSFDSNFTRCFRAECICHMTIIYILIMYQVYILSLIRIGT
ncbi:hypothetical protein QJ850_gp431 [Acanthamoeba polyphaga mimivirus]|uniref:Uncharacterized protein n=1 Tax=Acanthamoeba polyphaga mimivirus Kroon TaxID=3069720 RepID=A0A0G2Y3C2_9VIRU|nr:hypothetical protein QJ850_gp431 [Acanthamoeba polyphaga mimivirus]AKI80268.1 hypothetical protein [Acanthamoeba polyphaga mimivirus Kroon]